MKLENATIIVTGGAQGLGLAMAEHLTGRGAKVIAADRNAEALHALQNTLEGHVLDVTSPEQAKDFVQKVITRHGRIDALINNAGVIYSEPFVNILNPQSMMHDYTRFSDSLRVNLDSVFIMTSAVVEHMVLKRTKGVIINVSSISANGNEGQTAYSAAKAAVNAMTVTWSKELGRFGIRCNAIAPGFIDTPSTRGALSDFTRKHVIDSTPLHRMGTTEEVATIAECLLQNDFMNGAVVALNGGLVI